MKVNVFLQEQRQITLLHQLFLPFIVNGETPSRRTVTLEERCSFVIFQRTIIPCANVTSGSTESRQTH